MTPATPTPVSSHWLGRLARAARLAVMWGAIPVVMGVSYVVVGQISPPSIPATNLSSAPLYSAFNSDKPALTLALSVEFPTVGAQYMEGVDGNSIDRSYRPTNEYLGYYDAESCYAYVKKPTETPASGLTKDDYKRFDRIGPATGRKCDDAFSGNYLNWASGSAVDTMRLAMSGGDRVVDTPTMTILQRAMLGNGPPTVKCYWNSSNFPAKALEHNGGDYYGAVPKAMRTEAKPHTIWVANTWNRIYFRAFNQREDYENCTPEARAKYDLGVLLDPTALGPMTTGTGLPSGITTSCGNIASRCSFTGIKEVWVDSFNGTTHTWRGGPVYGGVDCARMALPGATWAWCYYGDYNGSWEPPDSGRLSDDPFFYARVQVCNTDNSGALQDVRDYALCTKYPNGNYKPTGTIQKYAEQLRLAAFGYLIDQTTSYGGGRYGGVLRAPMKYVGAKTFDSAGSDSTPVGGNPNAEWDANTGVLKANPDGDATITPGVSGVINYVNKFGRLGAIPGNYKIYDPVGELHYEALRYLQGLQPSPDAVKGPVTTDMIDGFPYFTQWTDPYGDGRSNTADYSCLKSSILVVGDINTHDGARFPVPDPANNIIDIGYWRSIVESFERKWSVPYVDGQGVTQTTSNPNSANPSIPTDTRTSQIMGSAYWANTHDIRGSGWTKAVAKQRPGLRVKTFIVDVNEYGWSSDPNRRSSSNQYFFAAKYGGFQTDANNSAAAPYNTKGNPFYRQDGTADNLVWRDPNRAVDPQTYYLASDVRAVLKAFDAIFNSAVTTSRNIAPPAFPSQKIDQDNGTFIYQGSFDTADWTGDLVSTPITLDASNNLTVGTPVWSAAARLAAVSPGARKIVMGNPGVTPSQPAADFTWGGVDASVRDALDKPGPLAAADGLGQDRLDYLRGVRTKEGSPFRKRSKLLGDIINSGVAYSGKPDTDHYESYYSAFFATNASRAPAVFVGANDGMLHAFNANTGDELFGYIPSWMANKLSALTSASYVNNHQSFVDATPVVAEAQVGSSNASTGADWKTVLVSGTGLGGSGVFALDVTNPAAFDKTKVLWEFTRQHDEDMGLVVGTPKILKIRTSPGTVNTPATYRWFAVVASGVNNYIPENGLFSSTGQPALFFLALDKAPGTAWALGTNYYKLSFPIDATLAASKATGMAHFNVTYGPAGEARYLFAGDLHGNFWKLDLSKFDPANASDWAISQWTVDKMAAYKSGTAARPMFVAKDAGGKIQSIFFEPQVYKSKVVAGLQTYVATFGTGKFIESSDKVNTDTQTVYALFDDGTSTRDSNVAAAAAISGRGRLQAVSVDVATQTLSAPAFIWGRAMSDSEKDATSGLSIRSGWYLDLPASSERLNGSITKFGDNAMVFSTIMPAAAGGGSMCGAALGVSNSYAMTLGAPSGSYRASTVGYLAASIVLEDKSGETLTASDSTGRRLRTSAGRVVAVGQTGVNPSGLTQTNQQVVGRLSWRQINSYDELKNRRDWTK